jgi:hypothetical protein
LTIETVGREAVVVGVVIFRGVAKELVSWRRSWNGVVWYLLEG